MWFPRLEVVKLVYFSAAYSQADLSCLIFDFVIFKLQRCCEFSSLRMIFLNPKLTFQRENAKMEGN